MTQHSTGSVKKAVFVISKVTLVPQLVSMVVLYVRCLTHCRLSTITGMYVWNSALDQSLRFFTCYVLSVCSCFSLQASAATCTQVCNEVHDLTL